MLPNHNTVLCRAYMEMYPAENTKPFCYGYSNIHY